LTINLLKVHVLKVGLACVALIHRTWKE